MRNRNTTFLIICIILIMLANVTYGFNNSHPDSLKIRKQRYPTSPDSVSFLIDPLIKKSRKIDTNGKLLGLIMPHNFTASNQEAAAAAKQLEGRKINTIFILSNSHRGFFKGLAIADYDVWTSQYGPVNVDIKMAKRIIEQDTMGLIRFNNAPHKTDHTIEMILPFLQKTVSTPFKIVPIVFGNSFYMGRDINEDYKHLAKLIMKNLAPDDIIIVSNDMSHFLPKGKLEEIDKKQMNLIKNADIRKYEMYEYELASQEGMEKKIYSCSKDGIKTILEIFNSYDGGEIEFLGHGTDDTCGYSSFILSTKSREYSPKEVKGK